MRSQVRPRIGVTSAARHPMNEASFGNEVRRHVGLLESVGAETVVLASGAPTSEALERYALSGILLSGGGDVAAERYGGISRLCWETVDELRDEGEVALVHASFARRLPVLCVCRGLQVANVALGGTLVEDIEIELGDAYLIKHHQVRELAKSPSERTHAVVFEPDCALARVLGTNRLSTNSMHHQAIRSTAAPLRAVGRSDDGVIEAIELAAPEFFWYGVQWHPESLPNDDASVRLYRAFVDAARRYRG
jgi:putative glutamine amidotransferase